jgi:hypothetical protein
MGELKLFNKYSVLNNNHDVRNSNYNIYGKNNYFEFYVPHTEGFDARKYSPMVYEEIPALERGTLAYDDFWDEQDRRCIEGYQPEGMPRITGPHYFYLNHVQIMMLRKGQTKKKLDYPYYRVLDHLIFLEIEKATFLGYGLVMGKARRMGLSYIGDCMIMWNLLFHANNEVAIGAGKEDKATELFDKVKKTLENLRPEYQVSYRKNKTELKFAYQIRENKVQKDAGIGSMLTVKTFFSDPSAFEGGSYSFFIFEEIGLQDNLIKSYKASEPCFMEGATQFGVPMLYGTGGEVDKGSRDMKIVYDNPQAYNLKKLFIPAFMYYPGNIANEEEENKELQKLEEEADFFDILTGRTDEEKALAHILERRKRASTSRDGYIKEVQSRPIKESDLFLKTSGGLLNRLLLNSQLQRINDKGDVAYTPKLGRLEWVYDSSLEVLLSRCQTQKERDKVHIVNDSKVQFIEDPEGTVYVIAEPINDPNNYMPYDADIGGTDSYDEVVPDDTGSMGATMAYRCFNGLSKDYNMPVALVYERGNASSDDSFYSNSLKLCVRYKMKTLVEYSKILIINYFEDCQAHKYLTLKPILRNEAIANKGRQTYGVHVKGEMKGIITRLLKHEVNNNAQNIWLDKILLDLIEYGDGNTDIAMAYGMCLISKLEMFGEITEDLEGDYDGGDVLMDMEYYTTNSRGDLVLETYGSPNDSDMETFDPRKHLEGEEREKYLNFMAIKKQKIKEEREKLESASIKKSEDPFIKSVKEEIKKRQDHDLRTI